MSTSSQADPPPESDAPLLPNPAAEGCYAPRMHVVLYQPEIPYNAGSVGRTCVAVEAKLWMVRPLGFRVDDYYLRRAGLDYWQHLAWQVVDDWTDFQRRLPSGRRWHFTKRGARSYADVRYQPGDVLVFGSESQGLPPDILDESPDAALRIPTRPEIRSLNVSNCAAIVLYEALRQWNGGFGDAPPGEIRAAAGSRGGLDM